MKLSKNLLAILVTVMTTTINASPLTKESAAEQVQSESGGKVLSVDNKQEGDQKMFRVKVLHDDGKIKIYQLDATTGKEIK